MSRWIPSLLLFCALPLAAECLSVVDQGMAVADDEPGAAQIAWYAQIDNHCERAQDALLTVQFVDDEDQRVYEVRDQEIIERLGSKRISREVYVPAHALTAITGMRILLEERERPF